ncbi:MAG: sulfotransferase family 2 domain-containing protein [Planctomycetes bacterium]|nr:sulfotransferase family 2 domain-containing protein [Planctomycetota bacterium]
MRKTRKIASRISDYTGVPLLREYLRGRNRKKAVFIWIPKTAGASFYSCLNAPKLWVSPHRVKYRFANNGTVTFGHMDYSELVGKRFVSRQFDESAYKFAFARNPYGRAVSLYFYLRKHRLLPSDESFLAFCQRLNEQGCEPIGLYNRSGLSQCNPQTRWTENIKMDFIGRFESIEEDSDKVFRTLGLQNVHLPWINKTDHAGYEEYYCRQSKGMIEEFYAEDFRNFGYRCESFI